MYIFLLRNLLAICVFGQLQCLPSSDNQLVLPSPFIAKVIGVKDGDTVEVLYEKQPYVIRLADIDCPEKGQAFGQNAKNYCSEVCFGKQVSVVHDNKFDRNKRLIATIIYEGKNINETLVAEGLAWHYVDYSRKPHISTIQQKAQAQKVGLWSDPQAMPPWEWRKAKRTKKPVK